jgi:hypothetical protein
MRPTFKFRKIGFAFISSCIFYAALLGMMSLLFTVCKPEEAVDPLKALNATNTQAFKNTKWLGEYKQVAFEGSYALVINNDNTFKRYTNAKVEESGTWSVSGNTISFILTTGAKTQWTADLEKKTLTNFTLPALPSSSFEFIGVATNQTNLPIEEIKVLVDSDGAKTKLLVNTEWYGEYRNKTGDNGGQRGVALVLRSNSAFVFYGAGFAHNGTWSVTGTTTGTTVTFQLNTGAKNKWSSPFPTGLSSSADLTKSLVFNFSAVVPDNFRFSPTTVNIIPTPPTDVYTTRTWTDGFTRIRFSRTGGVSYQYYYTKDFTYYPRPYTVSPIKDRIFITRDNLTIVISTSKVLDYSSSQSVIYDKP